MTPHLRTAGRTFLFLVLLSLGLPGAWAQPSPQTVTFTSFPTAAEAWSTFSFAVEASSGLPVTLTAGGVCTLISIPGGPLTAFLGSATGLCTITATQSGNEQYEPATATASVQVAKKRLEITITPLPASAPYGMISTVVATTPIPTYVPQVSVQGACTYAGITLTITGSTGNCVITASHPGDAVVDVITKTVVVAATKRPVTVSAWARSKFQGTPDPQLTYRITNGFLVQGDAFTGGPARNAGEALGTYQIYPANLALGPHYELTFIGAPFTIVALDYVGPPDQVGLGDPITVSFRFADSGSPGAPACVAYWHDPAIADPLPAIVTKIGNDWHCNLTHTYTAAGMYQVAALVGDVDGGQAIRWSDVLVYDRAGMAAGDGWFDSPAGAFAVSATLTGAIRFKFGSSYPAGGSAPQGEARFELEGTGIWLQGTVQQWLIVQGSKARIRGAGYDHEGSLLGYELTVTDGGAGPDRIRLVIWNTSGVVAYDNQPGAPWGADPGTPLAGGAIGVH